MPRGEHGGGKKPPAGVIRVLDDIRALNSSILIISQKMKYVVRNEKILGRNLIVLNKKLKTLEEKIASGSIGGQGENAEQVQELIAKLEETNKRLAVIETEISDLKQNKASSEQLQEMKYVIDTINPLSFATIEQVKEMLEEAKQKKKK